MSGESCMTFSRLALYVAAGTLFAAWLASALGVSRQPPPPPRMAAAPDGVAIAALAADVQAQAGRLRQRLAAAPAPTASTRNPFTFAAAPAPPRAAPRPEPPAEPPAPQPAPPVEPPLDLIGFAERTTADGPRRTAMIVDAAQELHIVAQGQTLGDYVVAAISADVVELKHRLTGATRRLILD